MKGGKELSKLRDKVERLEARVEQLEKRTNESKALRVLNVAVPILEAVAAIAALTVILLDLH